MTVRSFYYLRTPQNPKTTNLLPADQPCTHSSYCIAAVTLSPEGRGVWEAHVKVPTELHDRIPAPVGDERDELEDIAEGNDLDVQ